MSEMQQLQRNEAKTLPRKMFLLQLLTVGNYYYRLRVTSRRLGAVTHARGHVFFLGRPTAASRSGAMCFLGADRTGDGPD